MLKTINPSNNQILNSYNIDTNTIIETKLNNSFSEFNKWSKSSLDERIRVLLQIAEQFDTRKLNLAELMAMEMGKPLKQGIAEAEKCALVCRYYAENAEKFLTDKKIQTEYKSYVTYKPLGPILAIMPWNFPFWQVMRFAAPAIVAGNTIVLKHSSVTMGCGLEVENIFKETTDRALLTNLVIGADLVKNVISSKQIAAVTFTGSTLAGRKVAAIAGANLKKTVMELGGSDPYIILEDADLEFAAKCCAKARLINNGQSCIAAKRFIAIETVYEEFTELLSEQINNSVIGEPLLESTEVGPIATSVFLDELNELSTNALKAGGILFKKRDMQFETGNYFVPIVIKDVKPNNPLYTEETFGPIATVIKATDEKDAIRIANDTIYGLGGAIFSKNIEKAEFYAKNEIQTGTCFVNDFVRSDPRMPFGGIKESGYGRELSEYGLKEFVNIKSICVKTF